MKSIFIRSKELYSSMRLDSSYHLCDAVAYERIITQREYKQLKYYASRIFTAGRNKRIYTSKKFGYPYLSNSDIITQNPFLTCKYNSRKFGFDNNAFLKEGMIVTGRVGAIGQTAYITKEFEDKQAMGSDNMVRVVPKEITDRGFIYSFLTSKIGQSFLWRYATGGVQPFINEEMVGSIPVPFFSNEQRKIINFLISQSADLRVLANKLLEETEQYLYNKAGLIELSEEGYDYFGPRSNKRNVSCFKRSVSQLGTTTFNALNHSNRISSTICYIKSRCQTISLFDALNSEKFFTTGSFPRIAVNSDKAIMLINQSDIFNAMINGRKISRRKVKVDNLVKYGEILIAGVGTLGDNELFCRVGFANEDIQGQLISGEFIRMKTNDKIPSGFLFAWLNSDYGFRLIRSTQTGTKQCRPIHKLLYQIPVPKIEKDIMEEIDKNVRQVFTLRHEANLKEKEAINLVEKEIEQWQQ